MSEVADLVATGYEFISAKRKKPKTGTVS